MIYIKLILFDLPYDDFFTKVELTNNFWFYVPAGYSRADINKIVTDHNKKKRNIKFYKPNLKD